MHILCIALRYNKLNKSKNHKKYLICYVSLINYRAPVLFLGFQYFESQNVCKQIPNCMRIPILSGEFVYR